MPWAHGCDNKCTVNSSTDPFSNWESLADKVYLKAKTLALQLTDTELLSSAGVFAGGGSFNTWAESPGGPQIEYQRADSVFVPAVELPPPGSPKTAPTVVDWSRRYVYLRSGAGAAREQTWPLPPSWQGKRVQAATITPSGRLDGRPTVRVRGGNLTLTVNMVN